MAQAHVMKSKPNRLNAFSRPVEFSFHLVIGLFALLCIIPFIFVVIISFTSEESIRLIGYSFVPQELSLQAYNYVLQMGAKVWRAYANSFLVTVVGTALSVVITVLFSYALFRRDFKYRSFFSFFCFFTTIFGGGLIPTIFVCSKLLGLSENYAALIVPMLVSPFNIIIMRTFFQTTVPTELIEAATIDGCGEYTTLGRIILPIVKPGIATIALLIALSYWNDWFLAMLYIRTEEQYIPLQYLLMKIQRNAEFLARNSAVLGAEASRASAQLPSNSLKMVLVVLIVIPIACAYPFFQRYVVAGLTLGAVKG